MKPRTLAMAALAAALSVSTVATVSAKPTSFVAERHDLSPRSSDGSNAFTVSDETSSGSENPPGSAAGEDATDGDATGGDAASEDATGEETATDDLPRRPTSPPRHSLEPDVCLGLPRNTLLSSCPAPCLPDAPCIVFDQDDAYSHSTGCDYQTASYDAYCTKADGLAQSCELECFAQSAYESTFRFLVDLKSPALEDRLERNMDNPSVIATPTYRLSIQSNDFVGAIGRLNVSDNVKIIDVSANADPFDRSRYVEVDVDPALIASATALESLTLENLPLGSARAEAVLAYAPPTLKTLSLAHSLITSLAESTLGQFEQLEVLKLTENRVSFEDPASLVLPSLKELYLESNMLDKFHVVAPRLETLELSDNRFVRIPPSVFSFEELKSLNLFYNRIASPLVLSQDQVDFLNGLQNFYANPETLPEPDSGASYTNGINISDYLVDATATNLRDDPLLSVLVVSSENAQKYNDLLELRTNPTGSEVSGSGSQDATETEPKPPFGFLPNDVCLGVPRNTLLDNCSHRCPLNGACVVYDQDLRLSHRTGCDYDVASEKSFCTNVNRLAVLCEFHCFAVYNTKSEFKFLVPFKAALGEPITRHRDAATFLEFQTDEIPFLSNTFVEEVGTLTLTDAVTDISISGGRNQEGTRGVVADLRISSSLLSRSPSVTSLSLMNIDLGKSDLSAILASASADLVALNLRNTRLTTLTKGVFAHTTELETLTLTENDLTAISAQALTLPKLKNLYLSDNALKTIDVTAPNLETLDLSGNNLAGIPPSVFELPKLEVLILQDNPIVVPLVLSKTQLDLLKTLDLKLPAVSSPAVNATSGNVTVAGNVLPTNGTAATLGGTPVIVVSAEIAKQYNDQLQQKQQTQTNASTSQKSRSAASHQGEPSATVDPVAAESQSANSTRVSTNQSTTTGDSHAINGSDASRMPGSKAIPPSADDANAVATNSNRSLTSVLLFGGLGAALFVAVVFLYMFIRRKKQHKQRRGPDAMTPAAYVSMTDKGSAGSEIVSWWTDDDMLSHRLGSGDISDIRVIGSGSSGIMWLVDYRGGSQQLVSKRLIQGQGPVREDKAVGLFAEAKLASQLQHPSVVQFVGVAWTDKTDFQVLFEYMSNGNLSTFLAQTDAVTLPWLPEKLQLALDIIEALVYTHSFNPPLLHRDLKASNVLLDDDFKAKLGDFGCARVESESNTMTTSEIGTGRWLAPEILLGSTSYGASSDIYSFGIVLCELDTHQVPYVEESEGNVVPESALLQRVARGELRPSVSSSCPPEIQHIAEACLALDATKRPNAMQVAYMLRLLLPRHEDNR